MTLHLVNIERFSDPDQAASQPAHICAHRETEQEYHYWQGVSGKRYLHTVFSLLACPALPPVNYILVKRKKNGKHVPLKTGRTTSQTPSVNLADIRFLAARLGANEIHIHMLADDHAGRKQVEQDIRAVHFMSVTKSLLSSAANTNCPPETVSQER